MLTVLSKLLIIPIMKRSFLICLLLISFNANATAGAMMMPGFLTMSSNMVIGESIMPHNHMIYDEHNAKKADISGYFQLQMQANHACDKCDVCLAHCNAAIITEAFVFGSPSQSIFESDYQSRITVPSYSRLLRPPKLFV